MPRCSHCSYYTDKNSNLKRHEKSHSTIQAAKLSVGCKVCGETLSSRNELDCHYESIHDVNIVKKTLNFDSEPAFISWKADTEKQTKSRFVKHKAPVQLKRCTTTYYFCHRDGFFSSVSTGKRNLKLSGSNKINGHCPARMKTSVDKSSGSVKVEFVETHVAHTHVAHTPDLGRVHLTKRERKEVAAKIAAGIPFNDILKNIRNSIVNKNVEFIHLLTSEDLWNVQQEFNLNNEAVRHENDSGSVHSWVLENRKNEGSQVVRFYKQQGQQPSSYNRLPSHPDLLPQDFILIIANEAQLSILEQFGSDCICIDGNGTHGLNQYDFVLTTVMVLDELRQGFPCAFMLSNRSDATVMKLFFAVLKTALGAHVAPQVFMSDMAEAYVNAWCEVMTAPTNVLFCTWHVLRAWKKNLSKVNSDLKKAEVYKTLCTLLEETDEKAFGSLLEAALHSFDTDPDKRAFGKYFEVEYAHNSKKWAYCHRVHLGLNTNMHLESLHKTIKHFYFEGKKAKRLDKCLHILMRVIGDKLFDRLISSHRGKLTNKLSEIRKHHLTALKMKDVQLHQTSGGWSISSGSSAKKIVYSIVPWKQDCTCDLRCADCNICLHTYKCECLDSAIRWVICRHIHFMVHSSCIQQLQVTESPSHEHEPDTHSIGELVIDQHHEENFQCVIPEELSGKADTSMSLEKKKKRALEMFRATVNFAETMDEVDLCLSAIRPLVPTIEANRSSCQVLEPQRQVNVLKKMSPQKNFFSTKNKNRKKPRTPSKNYRTTEN